ncbi:hypothetical protein GMI68_07770 [Eggerthellaceae bacterium zg-886]|uniref:NlpC/P60 domain-containing protein n=2 Tax=Xiamenia xianingshaonis TaxID=2682776 RepID=A0ABX0IK77_9ACTN|nr:hypothetical protein [Xiamenia xianingshaonis]
MRCRDLPFVRLRARRKMGLHVEDRRDKVARLRQPAATTETGRSSERVGMSISMGQRVGKSALAVVVAAACSGAAATTALVSEASNPQTAYAAQAGWKKSGKRWWYQNDDGSYPKSGWKSISKEWYLFDQSGYMLTGWQQIDGKWYYLDGSGAMQTGWLQQKGKWYYLSKSGAMKTGWGKVGKTWYYFDTNSGAMRTGWQQIDGKWYYLDGSGAMQTGWLQQKGKWYYLTSSGAMKTGWGKVGKTQYYFDANSGAMRTGWLEDAGNWYYLDGSGAMHTGWLKKGRTSYFLNPSTGAALRGFQYVGGSLRFFDETSCAMVTKPFVAGSQFYLADEGGVVEPTGWYVDAHNNASMTVPGSSVTLTGKLVGGTRIQLTQGWNGWRTIGKNTYYCDAANNNTIAMGWQKIGGEQYYFDGSCAMVKQACVPAGDGTYWYMDKNGRHNKQEAVNILMRTAKSLLGLKYVWGGLDPEKGMDCSGFVYYCYSKIGLDPGRSSYAMQNAGVEVSSPQAGDIVLMYYNQAPNYDPNLSEHAALFAGGGMIYEEPGPGGKCQYVPLASKYSNKYVYRQLLS